MSRAFALFIFPRSRLSGFVLFVVPRGVPPGSHLTPEVEGARTTTSG